MSETSPSGVDSEAQDDSGVASAGDIQLDLDSPYYIPPDENGMYHGVRPSAEREAFTRPKKHGVLNRLAGVFHRTPKETPATPIAELPRPAEPERPAEPDPNEQLFEQIYPEEYNNFRQQSGGDRAALNRLIDEKITQEASQNTEKIKRFRDGVLLNYAKQQASFTDQQLNEANPFLETDKTRKEKFWNATRKRAIIKVVIASGLIVGGAIATVASHGALLPAVGALAAKSLGAGALATFGLGTAMDYKHMMAENPYLSEIAGIYSKRQAEVRRLCQNVTRAAENNGFFTDENGQVINMREAKFQLFNFLTKIAKPENVTDQTDPIYIENQKIAQLKQEYTKSEKNFRRKKMCLMILTGIAVSGAEIAIEGIHALRETIEEVGINMKSNAGLGGLITHQIQEMHHGWTDVAERHVREVSEGGSEKAVFEMSGQTHDYIHQAVEAHPSNWGGYGDFQDHGDWVHDMGEEGTAVFHQQVEEQARNIALATAGAVDLALAADAAVDQGINSFNQRRHFGETEQRQAQFDTGMLGFAGITAEGIKYEDTERRGFGKEITPRAGIENIIAGEGENQHTYLTAHHRFVLKSYENGAYHIEPFNKAMDSAGPEFAMSEADFHEAFIDPNTETTSQANRNENTATPEEDTSGWREANAIEDTSGNEFIKIGQEFSYDGGDGIYKVKVSGIKAENADSNSRERGDRFQVGLDIESPNGKKFSNKDIFDRTGWYTVISNSTDFNAFMRRMCRVEEGEEEEEIPAVEAPPTESLHSIDMIRTAGGEVRVGNGYMFRSLPPMPDWYRITVDNIQTNGGDEENDGDQIQIDFAVTMPDGTEREAGHQSTRGDLLLVDFDSDEFKGDLVEQAQIAVASETPAEKVEAEQEGGESLEEIDRQIEELKKELEKPAPKIQIIGDIHGDLAKLNEILDNTADKIIFTGDFIDRGQNSKGVLERVKTMVDSGKAEFILGNHEFFFLASMEGDAGALTQWAMPILEGRTNGGDLFLKEYGIDIKKYHDEFFKDPTGTLSSLLEVIQANQELVAAAKWLREKGNIYLVRDGNLIMHASPLADKVEKNGDQKPVALNQMSDFQSGRNRSLKGKERWSHNVAWSRGLDNIMPFITAETEKELLDNLSAQLGTKVDRIVFGHTPSGEGAVQQTKDGLLINIDAGMTDYYGGHGGSLYIDSEGIRFESRDQKGDPSKNPVIERKKRTVADTDKGKEILRQIQILEAKREASSNPSIPPVVEDVSADASSDDEGGEEETITPPSPTGKETKATGTAGKTAPPVTGEKPEPEAADGREKSPPDTSPEQESVDAKERRLSEYFRDHDNQPVQIDENGNITFLDGATNRALGETKLKAQISTNFPIKTDCRILVTFIRRSQNEGDEWGAVCIVLDTEVPGYQYGGAFSKAELESTGEHMLYKKFLNAVRENKNSLDNIRLRFNRGAIIKIVKFNESEDKPFELALADEPVVETYQFSEQGISESMVDWYVKKGEAAPESDDKDEKSAVPEVNSESPSFERIEGGIQINPDGKEPVLLVPDTKKELFFSFRKNGKEFSGFISRVDVPDGELSPDTRISVTLVDEIGVNKPPITNTLKNWKLALERMRYNA